MEDVMALVRHDAPGPADRDRAAPGSRKVAVQATLAAWTPLTAELPGRNAESPEGVRAHGASTGIAAMTRPASARERT